MLRPSLLALLPTLVNGGGAAEAPPPPGVSTSTVFTPGEEGYKAFRIPGIHSLNNTLLVFAEGRKYGCGDFAGQHVRPHPTPHATT